MRPFFAPCPFAGYFAHLPFESSPLPPIQWSHAVQAHASRCVPPFPDEWLPPASSLGLSSPRPAGYVGHHARGNQTVVHPGHRSRHTLKTHTIHAPFSSLPAPTF